MTTIEWPEPEGVLAYLRDRMASRGATLQVASQADLVAGFERARTAHAYEEDAAIFRLAALIWVILTCRHQSQLLIY